MELSVGKLAKMFHLSRTTLLYYDAIGLLSPSGRSVSKYRIYSDADVERLRQIVLYRDAGVPLNEIRKLITASENDFVTVLMRQLNDLNQEISVIKKRQEIIVNILRHVDLYKKLNNTNVASREALFHSIGMTGEQAMKWHEEFEQHSPEQHQHFLMALGMNASDIEQTRAYFRKYRGE